jgi:putative PIN family toxin of toxin-antitoxin system
MVAKKKRTLVVLDTNVLVRSFLSKNKSSASKRVIRLWLVEKELQLVVSPEIVAEYLETFERVVGFKPETVEKWRFRFETDTRTTLVGLSKRFHDCRDPDDNLVLATADAGKVDYLITCDKDLLDLPEELQSRLPLLICRLQDFLRIWERRT